MNNIVPVLKFPNRCDSPTRMDSGVIWLTVEVLVFFTRAGLTSATIAVFFNIALNVCSAVCGPRAEVVALTFRENSDAVRWTEKLG